MKIGTSVLLIVFAIFMSSCSAKKHEAAEQPPHIVVDIPTVPTEDIGLSNTGQETDDSSHGLQEVDRQTHIERYNAEHCFSDMLMPEKCWLITDEAIIQLISIADYDEVTIVTKDSAERTESAFFDEMVSIELFDKTSRSIRIVTDKQQADALLALLP